MDTITFEELKDKYQNKPVKDSEVTCKFLMKLPDGYLVDVNDEWEGTIPKNHLQEWFQEKFDLKEPVKALVISGPDKSDRFVVSPKALKEKEVWSKLEEAKNSNLLITVKISKPVKGGAEIFVDTIRAFLPGRYIRLPGLSPEEWVNREINVMIEELDYKEKKVILNQRKAVEIEREHQSEITIEKLREGDIVEAPILRIADFGVFVDLGGLDGLVPASELSCGRFNHPKEIVKVGDILKARIFRIDKENKRVALSVKQLLGDPWEDAHNEFKVGTEVQGKVVAESSFGLFVEIKPGVDALLHNSEIPEGADKLKNGDVVQAKVIKLDLDERKIGLSLRDREKREPQEEMKEPMSVLVASSQINLQELEGVGTKEVNEEVKELEKEPEMVAQES